jgi:hypothetical protein
MYGVTGLVPMSASMLMEKASTLRNSGVLKAECHGVAQICELDHGVEGPGEGWLRIGAEKSGVLTRWYLTMGLGSRWRKRMTKRTQDNPCDLPCEPLSDRRVEEMQKEEALFSTKKTKAGGVSAAHKRGQKGCVIIGYVLQWP